MATEVKQRNNRIVMVVLGLVLALAAFGLSLYVSRSGNNTGSTGSSQTVGILVAKVDLPQGTQLTPDLVTVKQYGVDMAPAGAATDITQVDKKYVSVTVTQNTPITGNLLVNDPAAAKTAALALTPLDIHKGNVAIAIPTGGGGQNSGSPELQTFGLYVQPEDRFDILIDQNGQVRYAFQDIRIVKVGAYSAQGNSSPSLLVVEMSRGEAEALEFLLAHSGQPNAPTIVKYVLRAHDDYAKGYQDTAPFNPPGKKDNPVDENAFKSLFPTH